MPQRPDDRVITMGQVLNEVMGMSHLGGLDDPRQRVARIAQADAHRHRIGEDEIRLEDDGDLGANRLQGASASPGHRSGHGRPEDRSVGGSDRPGRAWHPHPSPIADRCVPARNSAETPSSKTRPDRLSSETFSRSHPVSHRGRKMGSAMLMEFGLPFQELEDPPRPTDSPGGRSDATGSRSEHRMDQGRQ